MMKLRSRVLGRLQTVLLISFTLIAIVTVVVGSLTASVVINGYTERAEADRVARDMNLAIAFYERSLSQLVSAAARLATDSALIQGYLETQGSDDTLRTKLDTSVQAELQTIYPTGTHFIMILDREGHPLLTKGILDQLLQTLPAQGSWDSFPMLASVLSTGEPRASTEVIDARLLSGIGLADFAKITLKDTPKAYPDPFDSAEGTAGFAQVACYPILDESGVVTGAVLAGHLFNNDFTLVDRIQAIAGVDTVTIFHGDLRVSTNVREKGERAIGTRVSQAVYDTVLVEGEPFTGAAYVVNEWFITRYVPLHDFQHQVIGSLYVGARRATFIELQRSLQTRIALASLLAIVPAAVLALFIARLITRPLEQMAAATREVAQGNTDVRVPTRGVGEVNVLGQAFNTMIGELEKTQEELIRTEKLASMGQLAAGVAHQLNNPLGTIMLFSDILLGDMPEDDDSISDIQMISSEAQRAKAIVSDLLNFAREQEVSAHEISLEHVLHGMIERARQQTAFQHVEIIEEIAPDMPNIEADPIQLPNVFVNIMDNAAAAMPDGGTITVRANPVNEGECISVQIADTGTGIEPENISKIFSPFFTTKPVGQGTGLGLSIAYGIVKMHRGQIQVESTVGKGTTFTVTIPSTPSSTLDNGLDHVEPEMHPEPGSWPEPPIDMGE